MNTPDHPDIARVLVEGLPEAAPTYCPICGEEALILYRNTHTGDVVGCENCIETEYA